MTHAEITQFIEIDQNEGGYPLLVLPEDPNKWANDLRESHREDEYIGMFATNIADGGETVEIYFGANISDANTQPPTKYFGFVVKREVFRKMVKSLQLVLEASENE